MKAALSLWIGLVFSVTATAQTVPNVPAFPPPTPLSRMTLDKINKMPPIFDGRTLDGWSASVKGANQPDKASVWTVKDGALASLGAGRGVLFTDKSYANYRIIFTMRHISGNKDHQACVLIYCEPPQQSAPGRPALDALGGIQFQAPNGGHWDYRPGHNNGGKGEFRTFPHPKFDPHQWSQVEILVNTNGTARMAVAQPPGTRAYEVLDFNAPEAGRPGVFALQMHNKGLFDEYKDIRLEENPPEKVLITIE
ncbi:MAG TPA: DUF1080 domain-containing protein [Verrucomicrobiae bacterium]|nr:DUF1080 domain-containing protein [Verrucomicrobiae bacterium]